ncbi:MAG: hypothetical protein P4L51_09155 [Puia sp.]|nr:hypothetical protein [Puia sp.]
MSRILGLDMGTNSIGWAVVDYDRSYVSPNGYRETVEQFTLLEKGAHIFKEGVDKDSYGNPQSRAASRTDKRGARRLKFRKKLRKYETLKTLIKHGLCPLGIEELEKWRLHKNQVTNKNETFKHYPINPVFLEWLQTDNQADSELRKKKIKNPYYFRNKAATEKITTLYELGRAFYHLAQRRGFLSSRLDKTDKGILEIIKPELLNIISEPTNYTELHEQLELFFEDRISEDETNDDKILSDLQKKFAKEFKEKKYQLEDCKKFIEYYLNKPENLGPVKKGISDLSSEMETWGKRTLGQLFYNWFQQNKKIRSNYTGREEHYQKEFKEICSVQGIDDNSDLYKELYNSIFFQRQLKSQKGLIGKCTLEPNHPRCPVSHPAFEEFRLLKFINNIKIKDTGQWRQLVDEEKKKIWEKFFRKSKEQFDFKEIAKLLCKDYPTPEKKDEEPDPRKSFFNYKGNATVTGCPTTAGLMDIFGKDWKQPDWADRSWQDIITEPFWKKSLARQCKKNGIKDRKTNIRKGEKGVDLMVNDIWHALFTYNKESYLNKFAKDYFTDDEKIADKFSTIQLKQEYASFSMKAINNIVPFLREGLIESHAVFLAKLPDLLKDTATVENKWLTNIELQQQIRTALKDIIDNYQDNKRKQSTVNDLLKTFKDEYGNNDSDYQLDDIDKENIQKKLHSYYGEKSFNDKPFAEQEEIRKWISDTFQKQLQKKTFIKINRLDEEIKEFFLLHPGLGIDEKKVEKLYHPSDIERFKPPVKKIDKDGIQRYYPNSPISGSIKNPTVFRSLFQLRKVI